MLFPVRCFTCGKVLSQKYEQYIEFKNAGMPVPDIFQEIKVQKICCKRMFVGHVDVYEHMSKYDELPYKVKRTENVDKCRQYPAI